MTIYMSSVGIEAHDHPAGRPIIQTHQEMRNSLEEAPLIGVPKMPDKQWATMHCMDPHV